MKDSMPNVSQSEPGEQVSVPVLQSPTPLKTPPYLPGKQDSPTKVKKHRRFAWKWALPALLFLGVCAAVGGYLLSQAHESQPDLATMTVPVQTKNLTIRIEASGKLEPVSTVNISPKATGRLAALYVDQGDKVQAQQILARMDAENLKAQLAQAKAQLIQSEAEYEKVRNGSRNEEINKARAALKSTQAAAELSVSRRKRYGFLTQEGAISRNDLDQYISEDRSARANVEQAQQQLQELLNGSRPEDIKQAQAKLATSQAQVQIVQTQINDTVIRAPFDGIVTQKYATVGAIVTPTTSASATASATSSSIVAMASGLEVKVNVPETNIAQIKIRQKVEIIADSYPNRTFTGRVKQIAPEAVVEDDVTSFEVKVELLTGQPVLRSGMNVDVTFIGETVTDALVVPTVTITTSKGRMGVMVADEQGKAKFQPVKVGFSQGGETQIIKGLRPKARVFVNLPEGTKSTTPRRNRGAQRAVLRRMAR